MIADDVKRARQRAWYLANRERILAARKTPEGRVRHNARARGYYAKNKTRINEQARDRYRVARYGLTPEAFAALLAGQGGGCAICMTGTPARGWHVDHDHACCPTVARSCGRCVRGILCSRCNKALGAFKDSVELLGRAVAYLGGPA